MAYRNSAWTGRAPRTLEAAFGPHTRSEISERPTGYPPLWWFCLAAAGVATAAAVVIFR